MLDVARHFRTVSDVKRFVDLMALYKLNRLHLHLSDDQGWRIAIDTWPRLATHGGSTAVGGGKGGYYTQRQYADIVRVRSAALRRRSCPRSTCPATSTRRSPRTRRSPATGSLRPSTRASTSASARSASGRRSRTTSSRTLSARSRGSRRGRTSTSAATKRWRRSRPTTSDSSSASRTSSAPTASACSAGRRSRGRSSLRRPSSSTGTSIRRSRRCPLGRSRRGRR